MTNVTPCGGAIANSHSLGASGAGLMAKLIDGPEATDGHLGLQVMCIGHGMAAATIIERLQMDNIVKPFAAAGEGILSAILFGIRSERSGIVIGVSNSSVPASTGPHVDCKWNAACCYHLRISGAHV